MVGVSRRANQDEAPLVSAGESALRHQLQDFFLEINERKTDEAEQNHHRTRRDVVEKKKRSYQRDARVKTALEQLQERRPPRANHGPVIKTLRLQNQRRNHNQRQVK